MKHETIFIPIKVSERLPKKQGLYHIIWEGEKQYVHFYDDKFFDSEDEIIEPEFWLEPLENRYIFTKEELFAFLEKIQDEGLSATPHSRSWAISKRKEIEAILKSQQ